METAALKARIHQWVDEVNDPERLEEIAALLRPGEAPEPDEDTDEQVIENLREAFREMRRVERGEATTIPIDELIADLKQYENEIQRNGH
jgi:hypothetical protein